MSLQDPASKMSKSDDNPNNYISLLDEPNVILKKIRRAVTDSNKDIVYDEKRVGIYNLINIFSAFTGNTPEEIEDQYIGKMYSDFKNDLAEITIQTLEPIQNEYKKLFKDKPYLDDLLHQGTSKASRIAYKTLDKVYRKIGLVKKKRT